MYNTYIYESMVKMTKSSVNYLTRKQNVEKN